MVSASSKGYFEKSINIPLLHQPKFIMLHILNDDVLFRF